MKKLVVFCLLLAGFSSTTFAQGIEFEHNKSWNYIVLKAQAEKKLIFMDAYTVWCGPCKALQTRVFPNRALGAYFNANFVSAKIDMERGEGPTLAAKYRVRAYPTLFFIDPVTQKVVTETLGYREVDELLKIAKKTNEMKSI